MAAKAFGVIGSNYGDEGKGRTVDALVRAMGSGDVAVVRSNGGAQAGHTVTTRSGARHVFHHVGSGAFAGASTHLSRFFVHHPMMLMDEITVLDGLGASTAVSADPRGFVTTPWDMMVNQAVEAARGSARHGSCGYGFGETVGRNEETPFGLTFGELASADLRQRLALIRDVWLPARISALGDAMDERTMAAAGDPDILEAFLEDCSTFRRFVRLMCDAFLGARDGVVFEGAQGLLLDQNGADFPHVTRSNTGVANMASIAREAGIRHIDAVYVTRCYMTRHGAGPLPGESALDGAFDVVDPTNVPNPWQQSIRFALLDVDSLSARIAADARRAGDLSVGVHVAVSCLDQAVDGVPHVTGGRRIASSPVGFAEGLRRAVGASSVSTAFGPSAEDQDIGIAISSMRVACAA